MLDSGRNLSLTLGAGDLRGDRFSTIGGLTLNAQGGDIILGGTASAGSFIDLDACGSIFLAGADAGGAWTLTPAVPSSAPAR